MDKKQMYVQVVNLETGKVFSLPTLYTDRTEACVCGQNYVRDRQAEHRFSPLFFRVLNSYNGKVAEPFNIYEEEEEDDFDRENPACPCPDEQEDCFGCSNFSECWEDEDEDEEDTEEPDWEQHREDLFQSLLEYCRT